MDRKPAICFTFYISLYVLGTCAAFNVTHGEFTYTTNRYAVETVASLTCDYGYKVSGSSSLHCTDSGNWNQQKPTCKQSNTNIIFIKLAIFNYWLS